MRALALAACAAAAAATAATKPHVLMVIVDDFGWANVGYHRTPADDPKGEVQTPTMDSLCREGVELNQSYAFWYCSPSRSAIQTGRNPIHVNVNNDGLMIHNPADPVSGFAGIPRNMTTIAWKMREAGYHTYFYGKWHVGLATPDHTPAGRGWQESEIYFDGANDYWTSISGACANNATADAGGKAPTPITDLWLTGNGTQPAGGAPAYGLNNSWSCSQANQPGSCVYEDTFFVERLLAAIRSHDTATPFFGIFAPHNIHAPLQVPAAWLAKFSFIEDPRRQAYAAKVAWLDSQLALVVDALKTRSMWDNLLLVLTADNGGPIYDSGGAGANNFPMRGGKTSNWQGGARANSFVSGGLIPPARRGTVEQGFVSVEDWYSTFCALAGVDKTDTRAAAAGLPPVDSVDLWPLISGANATSPHSEIVLGMPTIASGNSYGDASIGVQAVIQADGYKLLIGHVHQNVWTSWTYPNRSTSWDNAGFTDCSAGCLFNIFADESEHVELSAQMPAKVAELRARIAFHNATMFRPDRGSDDNAGCRAALDEYHGFWGPFLP